MDEVKANSLFEKVILPLRDDEYLDGDGLPRCKSCHTLRVYVSDDKTFCARYGTSRKRKHKCKRPLGYKTTNEVRHVCFSLQYFRV